MGIGGSPLYTLGTAYIDENVAHKMQPVYSGKCFSFLVRTIITNYLCY